MSHKYDGYVSFSACSRCFTMTLTFEWPLVLGTSVTPAEGIVHTVLPIFAFTQYFTQQQQHGCIRIRLMQADSQCALFVCIRKKPGLLVLFLRLACFWRSILSFSTFTTTAHITALSHHGA